MSIDAAVAQALDAARAEMSKTLIPTVGPLVLVTLAVGLMVYAIGYVFQSIGLYSIAKRRGRSGAWLAWLPVGRTWVLGDISDNYQFVRKKKFQGWDMLLVKLQMGQLALWGAFCILIEAFVNNLLTAEILTALREEVEFKVWQHQHNSDVRRQWEEVLKGVVSRQEAAQLQVLLPLIVALGALAGIVVIKVFFYKAQYDVFASSRPEQKALFLVLGILFPVTIPYFVFACRKYDLGVEGVKSPGEGSPTVTAGQVFAAEP